MYVPRANGGGAARFSNASVRGRGGGKGGGIKSGGVARWGPGGGGGGGGKDARESPTGSQNDGESMEFESQKESFDYEEEIVFDNSEGERAFACSPCTRAGLRPALCMHATARVHVVRAHALGRVNNVRAIPLTLSHATSSVLAASCMGTHAGLRKKQELLTRLGAFGERGAGGSVSPAARIEADSSGGSLEKNKNGRECLSDHEDWAPLPDISFLFGAKEKGAAGSGSAASAGSGTRARERPGVQRRANARSGEGGRKTMQRVHNR